MNSQNTLENQSKSQDFDANSTSKVNGISDSAVSFEQLEQIRAHLGLSRRQICLLLKVDASAWSRWAKSENGAPLHIYQALNWYMQLVESNPQIHASYGFEKKFQAKTRENEMQIHHLKKQLQELKTKTEVPSSENRVEEFAEKLQESFENVILKMNSQSSPQKAMEIESLKYENRKLQDKLLGLQSQMDKLLFKLEKIQTAGSVKKPKASKAKLSKKTNKKKAAIKKKRKNKGKLQKIKKKSKVRRRN